MNTGTTPETGKTATATSVTSAGRGRKSAGASSQDAPPVLGSTSTVQSEKATKRALTPRLERQKLAIKKRMSVDQPTFDQMWRKGAMWGLRTAMKAMYPDAEMFVGQEPKANELVLTYLAVEEWDGD